MLDFDVGTPVLRLRVASGFLARLLGLHVVPFDGDRHGLMISPCRAIHTFGLKAPIDVVFLDRRGAVIRRLHSLSPNRIAAAWRGHDVIELPGGYCARHKDWARRIACADTDESA